jgi:hypothetical protein
MKITGHADFLLGLDFLPHLIFALSSMTHTTYYRYSFLGWAVGCKSSRVFRNT